MILSRRLAIVVALVALAACARDASDVPEGAPARRIVSLAPPLTEILFALGRGDRVVGRTPWCDTPAAAADVPVVGDAFRANAEALLAARPDLVLTNSRATAEEIGPLRDLFRMQYVSTDGIEDVLRAVILLGEIAEAGDEARDLAGDIRATLDAARVRTAARTRPRVLFVIDRDPFHVAGPSSYVGTLLDLAGGENVVTVTGTAYPAFSLESILAARPDVIIDAGADEDHAEALRYWSRFSGLPAVNTGRVHGLVEAAIVRPGPRIPRAIAALEALLHPASEEER